MRLAAPAFCAVLALCAGCIYRIDIQQGNVVVADQLAKVKPGMTRAEVRQALGTPLLTDPFHADRWDYWFYSAIRGKEVERNRVSVVFENEKVARIEGQAPVAIKGEQRSTEERRK